MRKIANKVSNVRKFNNAVVFIVVLTSYGRIGRRLKAILKGD
jgi:hypothetical protein